jgi:hypothetical protein
VSNERAQASAIVKHEAATATVRCFERTTFPSTLLRISIALP